MAVADDLEQTGAEPAMISPAPFNAEAPHEAFVGDITPTDLHYVRSNFAVPSHDGTLEVGGAVANPMTLIERVEPMVGRFLERHDCISSRHSGASPETIASDTVEDLMLTRHGQREEARRQMPTRDA